MPTRVSMGCSVGSGQISSHSLMFRTMELQPQGWVRARQRRQAPAAPPLPQVERGRQGRG